MLMSNDNEDWDLVIRPKARLFSINFREIWRYKDLLVLFVKRDFVAAYKQTVLGPLWHFIQPVLTSIMFLIVFTRIARLPTDGVHPVVFYLSGITLWNYFSISVANTSNTFVNNASIFGKVYFPRIISPLSVIISNVIRFIIQFTLLLTVMIYFSFHGYPLTISLKWALVPLIVAFAGFLALGIGIIISSITTRYRDFSVLMTFVVQLWMYGTPIAYPLSYLDSQGFGRIARLNPMTSIVEAFRYILFEHGTFSFYDVCYSMIFMLAAMLVGMVLFNKIEKNFIDTV
jgi:lipopolysaccharide transport system permease protein